MEPEHRDRASALVVDDDGVMRELLAALLNLRGEDDIHTVASGEEALAWLQQAPAPRLVLTDLQMPGLEGEALLMALRQGVPVDTLLVGMSGNRPAQSVLHLLDAFIAKPFDSEELDGAIRMAAAARTSAASAARSLAAEETAPSDDQTGTAPVLNESIFAALMSRFRPEHLVELYDLTVDDVQQRLKHIEEYAAAGDLSALRREAHSIKGACGMVGAGELQSLAAALEGGTTINTSAIADFPAACVRLRRMLDAKFQDRK